MAKETTLSKKELSSIKHTLYEMLNNAKGLEEHIYEGLVEALDGLTFKDYSISSYAIQLYDIVVEMIDLDKLGFEMGQLYHFEDQLKPQQ